MDEKGADRELAKTMGVNDLDSVEIRNEFRRRLFSLALEAYRRDGISRSKLKELGLMVRLLADEIDRIIENAGLDYDTNERPET